MSKSPLCLPFLYSPLPFTLSQYHPTGLRSLPMPAQKHTFLVEQGSDWRGQNNLPVLSSYFHYYFYFHMSQQEGGKGLPVCQLLLNSIVLLNYLLPGILHLIFLSLPMTQEVAQEILGNRPSSWSTLVLSKVGTPRQANLQVFSSFFWENILPAEVSSDSNTPEPANQITLVKLKIASRYIRSKDRIKTYMGRLNSRSKYEDICHKVLVSAFKLL